MNEVNTEAVDEVRLVYRLEVTQVDLIVQGLESLGATGLADIFHRHLVNEDTLFELQVVIPTNIEEDPWREEINR